MRQLFRTSIVLVFVVLPLGLGACNRTSQTASYDKSRAETEIHAIERDWAQVAVSADTSVIERIFADDFRGISPEGKPYTKAEFIEDTKTHPLNYKANDVQDFAVRFFGDVAVAQGNELFTERSGNQGRFVWTDVLVRRANNWFIVAAQDVVVPAGNPTKSAPLFTDIAGTNVSRGGIDATRNAYVAAWRKGDSSAIAELYADDAIVLYPNQPPVSGRTAIREYFTEFFRSFARQDFALESNEIVIAGDLAFDRGSYRWRGYPHDTGKPESDDGKYLVVLRRRADGQWQVARDMDNSNRPGTQSERK